MSDESSQRVDQWAVLYLLPAIAACAFATKEVLAGNNIGAAGLVLVGVGFSGLLFTGRGDSQ